MALRLDHVAVTVADRERSAAFYGEHFGMTERTHDDEHLLILGTPGGDGGVLALREGPVRIPRSDDHFGFRAATADDVRAARERFRAAGVREAEFQDDEIVVRVQVFDPDGYRVEMYVY